MSLLDMFIFAIILVLVFKFFFVILAIIGLIVGIIFLGWLVILLIRGILFIWSANDENISRLNRD